MEALLLPIWIGTVQLQTPDMSNLHQYSGSIPANYDKYLGPHLFEPYAVDLVERLQNDECKIILELACGTGRVTTHLVKLLDQKARLVASDINNDMLENAKTKVNDNRVQWKVVDAQELPFSDNCFDHVICQFGVMFFPDKLKAFKEVHRVLSAKGTFLFNTWGSLNDNDAALLIRDVLKEVFNDEAPDFLQKGAYSFYDPGVVEKLLTEAGFKYVSVEPVRKTTQFTEEELTKGFLDGTPLSSFLAGREASIREVVEQKLRHAIQQQFGFRPSSKMLAYACIGIKP